MRSALTQVLQRTCVIYQFVPHALNLYIFWNNKHAFAVLKMG